MTDGLSSQKSSDKCKQEGKSRAIKRKPEVFKEDFIDFRDGNLSKNKLNDYYNENNLEGMEVNVDEIDTSNKVLPSFDSLWVQLCFSFYVHIETTSIYLESGIKIQFGFSIYIVASSGCDYSSI